MFDEKIRDYLSEYLTIVSETIDEISCYCPFHTNTNTPAMSINKKTGLWVCFNSSCNARGTFPMLVKKLTGKEIARWFKKDYDEDELLQELEDYARPNHVEDFEEALERISVDYDRDYERLQYLTERGFSLQSLRHFEVGFSEPKQRVVVPLRDENHKLVGLIGRTICDAKPKYLYTNSFPRRSCLLNLNNAKRYSEVIITEGSLDFIKVHQSGFPNVVSTMGSSIPREQGELLNKYFDSIVFFMDNDEPGMSARHAIMGMCKEKSLWQVAYPDMVKDPGEMNDNQIHDALLNKTNILDYF